MFPNFELQTSLGTSILLGKEATTFINTDPAKAFLQGSSLYLFC